VARIPGRGALLIPEDVEAQLPRTQDDYVLGVARDALDVEYVELYRIVR
jgi:hypothetical protein